jgi:hypothetical protein
VAVVRKIKKERYQSKIQSDVLWSQRRLHGKRAGGDSDLLTPTAGLPLQVIQSAMLWLLSRQKQSWVAVPSPMMPAELTCAARRMKNPLWKMPKTNRSNKD